MPGGDITTLALTFAVDQAESARYALFTNVWNIALPLGYVIC